jgi:hypothetical protein
MKDGNANYKSSFDGHGGMMKKREVSYSNEEEFKHMQRSQREPQNNDCEGHKH